jgi:hypothetical protein
MRHGMEGKSGQSMATCAVPLLLLVCALFGSGIERAQPDEHLWLLEGEAFLAIPTTLGGRSFLGDQKRRIGMAMKSCISRLGSAALGLALITSGMMSTKVLAHEERAQTTAKPPSAAYENPHGVQHFDRCSPRCRGGAREKAPSTGDAPPPSAEFEVEGKGQHMERMNERPANTEPGGGPRASTNGGNTALLAVGGLGALAAIWGNKQA